MIFLVDHNLEGHALLLSDYIASLGWLELLSIRFITFEEIELSVTNDDEIVWQFAQANQMILLTANRSMKGKNSLKRSIPAIMIAIAHNFPHSFPLHFILSLCLIG